jgi:CRP/FNR family transcriptional regulator, cyclic AMP receptor protein
MKEHEEAASLYSLIEKQPIFKDLSRHHLEYLASLAMPIEFEPDRLIFKEGNPANRFYVILEGKVALETKGKKRGMVTMQVLGPGEDLGWSWLFLPCKLQANARAITPTKAIFFYGTRLRQQCEDDHELGYELMKRMAQVMIRDFQVMRAQLANQA